MTTDQAKQILLDEGLYSLSRKIPAGLTIDEVVRYILQDCSGQDLDIIIGRHYGLTRIQGVIAVQGMGGTLSEPDDSYRHRAYSCYIGIDDNGRSYTYHKSPVEAKKKACSHSWKNYQGLMESYDYCINCDEKRR